MKTNLFRCGKPGEANQMALRYIFANTMGDEEIKAVAFSLIRAITGFDPDSKELKIARIWPTCFGSIGLNVEIRYGGDLYHLSFFFFEYGSRKPVANEMLRSTSCLRGDYHFKGCFLIHYRPEDSDKAHFHGWKETAEGSSGFVHANGRLVFDAIGNMECSDSIAAEYIDYIKALRHEMTTEEWGDTWISGPIGFENYVENYLRYLFARQYDNGVSLHFSRSGWKTGSMRVSIDTGFDIHDPRGEFVESWFILEFRVEFPRPVASVRVKGDCFCFEDPEDWICEDNIDEAFYRMRKTLDQEGSLFLPKGGKTEPESLVGEYKEGGISLKGEYAWSVLFPKAVFQLVDNILKLLGKKKSEDDPD